MQKMNSYLKLNYLNSESSLSFSNENIVTEGVNMRSVKAVRYNKRFLSLAQIDKLYHELESMCIGLITCRNTHA